jgi:hypothetical protein
LINGGDPGQIGTRVRWAFGLVGLFAMTFAVVALSGPGRMDIVDGQTRYEVARSLVEHGDSVIRDPDVWFAVFTGRDGQRYTPYRFPQTVAGVVAIELADHTGPVAEGRRHFFFTLTSAFAAALLAVLYAQWFRSRGLSRPAALAWAAAGIFCTPSWNYGTSTFDDILGAFTLVGAFTLAVAARRRGLGWSLAAGLVLGLAFNCKQPLALFVLPVLAAADAPGAGTTGRLVRALLILAGLGTGVLAYKAYDSWKFPAEALAVHADEWVNLGPVWTPNPVPPLLSLTVSPGAGALWYCPTVLLACYGLAAGWRREKIVCICVVAASVGFLLFLSFVAFYKGEPSWGPRYLTPVLALGWLWAPAGAAVVPRRLTVVLLTLGLLVQLLALSVDPQRLHLQRALPNSTYAQPGWLHFDLRLSHLVNRPREVVEVCTAGRAPAYTPAPSPTYATPAIRGSATDAVHEYQVFASLRPWWVHQPYLEIADRPVGIAATVLFFGAVAAAGLGLLWVGCGGIPRRLS